MCASHRARRRARRPYGGDAMGRLVLHRPGTPAAPGRRSAHDSDLRTVMDLRLKRTPGLYLVGFMGCGKSTVGRLVADALGWRFVDVDDDIEAREGCPISDIFETRGEREFRRIESEAI